MSSLQPVDLTLCEARMLTLVTRLDSMDRDITQFSECLRGEVIPAIQEIREQQIRMAEQFVTVIRMTGEDRAERRELRRGLLGILARALPYVLAALIGGASGQLVQVAQPDPPAAERPSP